MKRKNKTCRTHSDGRKELNMQEMNTDSLPEVRVFLRGKLLSDVTLLLSAESATEGNGVGVSECERSCMALPPEPQLLELCEP